MICEGFWGFYLTIFSLRESSSLLHLPKSFLSPHCSLKSHGRKKNNWDNPSIFLTKHVFEVLFMSVSDKGFSSHPVILGKGMAALKNGRQLPSSSSCILKHLFVIESAAVLILLAYIKSSQNSDSSSFNGIWTTSSLFGWLQL